MILEINYKSYNNKNYLNYLVVPAIGETIAAGLRAKEFNIDDFPILFKLD